MNCPVCNVTLTMTDRQGVEIDYCAKCRGVWLDRGELDKIIERSVGSEPQYPSETRFEEPRSHQKHHDEPHYKQHDDRYYGHKKKKKESFLSDLFDF
jgi:Zn-finger nucleic acid-binding protein